MSCQTAFAELFTRHTSYETSLGRAVLAVLPTLVVSAFAITSCAVHRRGDRVPNPVTTLLCAFVIAPVSLLAFGMRELIQVAKCEESDAFFDRLEEWSLLITAVPIAASVLPLMNSLCARQIEIFTILLLTLLSGACGVLDYARATRCKSSVVPSLCRTPLMALQLWFCVSIVVLLFDRCGTLDQRRVKAPRVNPVRFVDPLFNQRRQTDVFASETPTHRAFF